LQKDGTGFRVTGVTTHRPNIVYFSNLFDNGSIITAKYRKIRSFTVWDFDIRYDFPTVDWYKMMEADAEQLRKYQEEKNRTAIKDLEDTEPTADLKSKITQKATDLKNSANKLDTTITVRNPLIDIPFPVDKYLSKPDSPEVNDFYKIVTAFNDKNDWVLVDLGTKYVKTYPSSPLKPYVQWYNAYRAWADKQYNKVPLWNDPIMKTRGPVYPYSMLLHGIVARDRGEKKYGDEVLAKLAQDYSQHPVGKTASKLLKK
jgi:hypothetical protein